MNRPTRSCALLCALLRSFLFLASNAQAESQSDTEPSIESPAKLVDSGAAEAPQQSEAYLACLGIKKSYAIRPSTSQAPLLPDWARPISHRYDSAAPFERTISLRLHAGDLVQRLANLSACDLDFLVDFPGNPFSGGILNLDPELGATVSDLLGLESSAVTQSRGLVTAAAMMDAAKTRVPLPTSPGLTILASPSHGLSGLITDSATLPIVSR